MDDQDHTLQLLRDGSVLGAVTAESQPVKGCNVHPLGAMRYHAIASPGFARQYFRDGMQAATLAHAPMLVFNRKDELQWRFVRRLTRAAAAAATLPSSTGFVEAAACGLGWGMAPETLVAPAVRTGRVVVLEPPLARCAAVLAACRRALKHAAAHHPGAAHCGQRHPSLRTNR